MMTRQRRGPKADPRIDRMTGTRPRGGALSRILPLLVPSLPPGSFVVARIIPMLALTAALAGCADATYVLETLATKVTITPKATSLGEGQTLRLTVAVTDQRGAPLTDRPVTFVSLDTSVALVSGDGIVLAHPYTGTITRTARIVAMLGALADTSVLSILPAAVGRLRVVAAFDTLFAGDSARVSAVVEDAVGRVLSDRSVRWRSTDTMRVAVDTAGRLLARDTGAVSLVATADGVESPMLDLRVRSIVPSPALHSMLSADHSGTCMVLQERGYCWGAAGAGDGTRQGSTGGPAPVMVDVQVRSIAAGTCAIDGARKGWCWGIQQNGAAGNGVSSSSSTSTRGEIAIGEPVIQLVRRELGGCALGESGRTWCWGFNGSGAVGDGSFSERPSPTLVEGGHRFRQLAAGPQSAHVCGIRMDGRLLCWGANNSGQLGDGSTTARTVPTLVATAEQFVQVFVNVSTTCALRLTGEAICWGNNAGRQLLDGTTTNRSLPQPLATPLRFIALAIGSGRLCGVARGGLAYCWGSNLSGRLGDGTEADRSAPTPVAGGHRFVSLTAGQSHTCGLTVPGLVRCWGSNASGQLGDGTNPSVTPVPVDVPPSLGVAVGLSSSCAWQTNGIAWCWGANESGQAGNGTGITPALPARVAHSSPLVRVVPGSQWACALDGDGQAFCWGANVRGQLGDGSQSNRSTPVRVVAAVPFRELGLSGSAAFGSACGLTNQGETWCWGDNQVGQAGEGAGSLVATPVRVRGVPLARQLSVNQSHCVISEQSGEGPVVCWGYNGDGQVDWQRAVTAHPVPRRINPAQATDAVTDLAVYGGNVCAVQQGVMYCWGQIRVSNTTTGAAAPTAIPLPGPVNALSPGIPCALVSGDGWWCLDSEFLLDAGRSTSGFRKATEFSSGVAATAVHACRLAPGGAVVCWGRNDAGQLGRLPRSLVPVAVLSVP